MEKRYQVFVSSTYQDLQKERQEVMHALLELDCIPSGMELFPAADEAQWELIKRVIHECDYYIVILGGRYGSLGPSGVGYTEMEYRYAEEARKPIIAFLHKDPDSIASGKTEKENPDKLKAFRNHLQQRVCKYWNSAEDLGGKVSRSIVQLKKTRPAVGWIRADQATDAELSIENTRLRKIIDQLESRLSTYADHGPKGTEDLAQGNDKYKLHFTVSGREMIEMDSLDGERHYEDRSLRDSVTLTWDDIARLVLPSLLAGAPEETISSVLGGFMKERRRKKYRDLEEVSVGLSRPSLEAIVVQLRSLGLIESYEPTQKTIPAARRNWKLTPYGETVMTRRCAIKRVTS